MLYATAFVGLVILGLELYVWAQGRRGKCLA